MMDIPPGIHRIQTSHQIGNLAIINLISASSNVSLEKTCSEGEHKLNKAQSLFYRVRSSLVAKIAIVSFVCVHIPLLGIILLLLGTDKASPLHVLIVMVGTTVLGTLICLYAIWAQLRPVTQLKLALDQFEIGGVLNIPRALTKKSDEVGRLAETVSDLVLSLNKMTVELRSRATTDVLTGLRNRRWLIDRVSAEPTQSKRNESPASLILFDVDHFKAINDSFGHVAGDQVLMAIGETVKDMIRPYDLAARIGGEEFCIVLPRSDINEAFNVAERLRISFENLKIPDISDRAITCSFGVTPLLTDMKLTDVLRQADIALYEAKGAGRNRVMIWTESSETKLK